MTSTTSESDSDCPYLMTPSFLPQGEVLGWSLTSVLNPTTKKREFTYTVSVQTTGAFRGSENAETVLVTCDGPCKNRVPSNHLISMGKCDHLLCKACFGLVKNPDGSYGCSNFDCCAEPREGFRKEKNKYRRIIDKQINRARKLKKDGEDVKTCNYSNLPETPANYSESDSEVNSKQSSSSSTSSDSSFASSSSSNVDSFGLPKMF